MVGMCVATFIVVVLCFYLWAYDNLVFLFYSWPKTGWLKICGHFVVHSTIVFSGRTYSFLWCSRSLFCSKSVKICRFQGVKVCLHSGNGWFYVSVCGTVLGMLMLKRAFMLAALFKELLVLGFCYRVGDQFIPLFNTIIVLCRCSHFIFFVTWFHAWTLLC